MINQWIDRTQASNQQCTNIRCYSKVAFSCAVMSLCTDSMTNVDYVLILFHCRAILPYSQGCRIFYFFLNIASIGELATGRFASRAECEVILRWAFGWLIGFLNNPMAPEWCNKNMFTLLFRDHDFESILNPNNGSEAKPSVLSGWEG